MSKDLELTLRLNADGTAMITTVKKADKALDGLGGSAKRTAKKLSTVTSRLRSLAFGLATAFGVGSLIRAQREFDVLNAQLITATGSIQAAKTAFDQLNQFAATTPYALAQAVQGFTQLKNLGLDPSMESMRSYGNFAAAMGKDLNQMIEAVADASTMEFERLKEFGIKAKQSQNEVAFTFQGITTTVAKNAEEIQRYLLSIGETQFADAMANRASTLDGAISNLGDSFANLKRSIMSAGLGDALQNIVRRMSAALTFLAENMGKIVSTLKLFFNLMMGWAAYKYLPGLIGAIATATRAWATAQTLLNAQLGAGLVLGNFSNKLKIAKGTIKATAKALFSLKGAVGVAASGFVGWKVGEWAYNNFTVVRSVGYETVVSLIDYWDSFIIWIAQMWNGMKAIWAMINGSMSKHAKAASLIISASWSIIKGGFAKMGVALLTLAKNIIQKIGGGFKSLAAMISSIMAGALQKVRNGLSGLGGFELFGKKVDLIPNSVINALDSRINTLKNKAADTAYSFTGLDGAIGKLNASISANAKNVASAGKEYQAYADKIDNEVAGAISNLTSKNDALAAIRAKNHDYNMRDIADYQAYNEAGKAAANVKQELARATETASDAIEKTGGTAGKAGKKLKGMGDDAKKAAKETSLAAQALEKAKKAINDAAAGLFAQLFPGRKLLLDMRKDAQTLANAIGGNAAEAMQKYGLSVDDVAKKSAELNKIIEQFTSGKITKEAAKKAFDDMKKGIESVKEASKDAGNVMQEQFKRAVESIDQSFANMWKSLLDGGKISFKNLADNFKNIFAEVLHSATTKPLTNAIMDSITGEVTQSGDNKNPAKGIINTLNDGFGKVEESFTKGLEKLFNVQAGTSRGLQLVGKALAGGVIGAGIGAGIGGIMGADNAGAISLVSGIAGSLATAGATAMGFGAAGATGLMALSATGVGAIVAAVVAIVASIASKKADKISRSVVTSRGDVTRSQTNEIKASVSEDIARQFWQSATGQANKYGVQFADDLAAMVTYKTHRKGKGPMMWYFDLFKDADADGERDDELFYNAALKADDDPKKIALALAQMQVAALATADWTPVSKTIAHGMTGISPDKMGMDEIGRFNNWLDQTILVEKAYGNMLDGFTNSLTNFSGSFTDFLDYTQAVYALIGREGQQMVDDMMLVFKNNTDFDWATVAQSVNVLTQGMDLLGQTSEANNYRLIWHAESIVDAMGGVEAATQTYLTIFNATATETHKAGIAYQTARQQLDLLNASMSLSGDAMITTTDQLRAYVATLDPLSENYAAQIRWAGQMAGTLTATANASKYFDDAIAGINATINGVINSIKEDMMSEQELYAFRKSQAEQLAASIAQMTDVSEIRAAADEASKLVSNMWRSLTSEQQTTGVGDWMIDFLEEMDTLAKGKIEAIQNEYGADNEIRENYTQIETAANNMIDVAQQQQQAGDKMIQAADNMRSVTDLIQRAAATMQSAAEQFNRPVDVDVTVQQVAVGGEIN